jgi:DNA-binding beta-propeller fold protein YncE
MSLGTVGYGIGITPDGTQLYLALPLTGEVRILDRGSRALVRTLAIGGTPRNVAFDRRGEVALVTNEQAVVFIR